MIAITDLVAYIDTLRGAGIVGRVKLGDIEFDIPAPPATLGEQKAIARSAKADYDKMLFAATEGIPDEAES